MTLDPRNYGCERTTHGAWWVHRDGDANKGKGMILLPVGVIFDFSRAGAWRIVTM